jgi:hypothetical protein
VAPDSIRGGGGEDEAGREQAPWHNPTFAPPPDGPSPR